MKLRAHSFSICSHWVKISSTLLVPSARADIAPSCKHTTLRPLHDALRPGSFVAMVERCVDDEAAQIDEAGGPIPPGLRSAIPPIKRRALAVANPHRLPDAEPSRPAPSGR